MPTVITHAAVPLCIGLGLGSKVIPPRLLFAGIILAMLPDADVLSFKFGVAYGNVFGSSRVYPFAGVCVCCPAVMCADWTPMVQGWADSLLAVFNRLVAIAQLAGFGNHWR